MQPTERHISASKSGQPAGQNLKTAKMPKASSAKGQARFKAAQNRAAYPKFIKSPGIDRARLFDTMATNGGINTYYRHHAKGGDVVKRIHTPYPVPTHRLHAKELEAGALLIDKYVRTVLKDRAKFWEHLKNNCPTFGLTRLVTPQIAAQLHKMYVEAGVLAPGIFDVMLTKTGWKVVEAQTACGYLGAFMKAMTIASTLEENPIPRKSFYAGPMDPRNAIVQLRTTLVDNDLLGKDDRIYVVDVEALTAGMVEDKRLLAKRFQAAETQDCSPITYDKFKVEPLDLCKIEADATGNIYFPEECYDGGVQKLTGSRIYPKAIFCRATPLEIISLVGQLMEAGNDEKARQVCAFFTNHDIKWVLHPAVYTMVDKATLKDLGTFARKINSPVAKCFPAMFSPSEVVPTGSWVIKPTDGNSGVGVSMVQILTKSDALNELPNEIRLKSGKGAKVKMSKSVAPGRYEIVYPDGFYVEPTKKVDEVIIIADSDSGYQLSTKEMAQERFDFIKTKMEIEVPFGTKLPKDFGTPGRVRKDKDGNKWQVFYIWGIEEHRGMLAPSSAKGKHSVILAGRRGPYFDPEERDSKGRPTQIVKTNVGCGMTAMEGIMEMMGLSGDALERVKVLWPTGIGPLYVAERAGNKSRKSR